MNVHSVLRRLQRRHSIDTTGTYVPLRTSRGSCKLLILKSRSVLCQPIFARCHGGRRRRDHGPSQRIQLAEVQLKQCVSACRRWASGPKAEQGKHARRCENCVENDRKEALRTRNLQQKAPAIKKRQRAAARSRKLFNSCYSRFYRDVKSKIRKNWIET